MNVAVTRMLVSALALVASSILMAAAVTTAAPPVIPIGLDAYRHWERWPVQRIGVRAYMRSTYDRRGGNEGADASHFLYQLADDNNVTLDVAGSGVLYFFRYNHWHGSPWRYFVDGTEHLVQESSTATRNRYTIKDSIFQPQEQFPYPLAVTWAVTKGADLSWVPIEFEHSFRLGYSWTCYGTGYYIYHQWVSGMKLSQSLRAWDGKAKPDADVIDLFNRAGTDLLPASGSAAAIQLGLAGKSGMVTLPADKPVTVLATSEAPAMVRALDFSVPRTNAIAFGRARLRITWDDRPEASVDAPVALFFGAGTLYNRENREFLVKAFPVNIRYDANRVHLACYFPMPFFKSARIELVGNGESEISGIEWRARLTPLKDSPGQLGYFHATYRDHGEGVLGQDLTLLDTRGIEGSADWSGSFIGTSFIFSDRSDLTTLEGDPRFFFDDSRTPQAYGTGTEEWGGGGDYWGGVNMTLPFAGHPTGARSAEQAKNAEDNIQSAYRFLLADLMPFGKNARICLEHGGENLSKEHYRTVTYWYGQPDATFKQTDSLQLGDAASEQQHKYVSPEASAPYPIKSRYELGPDTISGLARPKSAPEDYAEFEFAAEAGKPYFIWLLGRTGEGKLAGDQVWLQFDDEIGTGETREFGHEKNAFGFWSRNAGFVSGYTWGSGPSPTLAKSVVFKTSGKHRLRIQPRKPVHRIEEIWLSLKQGEKIPPGRDQNPTGGVVLKAADVTAVKGQVKLMDDPLARSGKVLELGGEGTLNLPPLEIYPAHVDMGRKTTGTSEFNLRLDPKNMGVMLRRKLDYSFPNQRAEVFVADAQGADWKPAGIWYLAGANTCVFSRPKDELGATVHTVQTSNRRFRDDEFLLPRDLTAGRNAIRVRVKFTPTNIRLFPGRPLDEQAWSEIRYDAYCWILPRDNNTPPRASRR